MTDRSHPVSTLLYNVACGHRPSVAELDAIAELGGDEYPTLRQEVEEAAERIRERRRGESRERAHDDARETAAELIGKLPAWVDNDMDPRSLASKVGRS